MPAGWQLWPARHSAASSATESSRTPGEAAFSAGQHQQLANRRIVERALDLARNHLVVAHVDDLAVGLAHDARRRRPHWRMRGSAAAGCTLQRGGRLGSLCGSRGVGGAILRILEAAEDAGAGAGHQQKHCGDGARLQAGKVVQDALAEPLIPALGRQRVQSFVEPKTGARDKIRTRLDDRMRIGENLERQDLLALFLASQRSRRRAARVRGPARRAAPHKPP